MSRSRKGSKGPGFDYGSKRPTKSSTGHAGWTAGHGPEVKKQTHRAERRQGKAETQRKNEE